MNMRRFKALAIIGMIVITFLTLAVEIQSASATILSTITTRVREYLYETSSTNSIYSDTMIYEAIAQSQRLLLNVLPVSANYNFQTTATVVATPAQSAYTLPTDFRTFISATYNGIALIQAKPETFQVSKAKATVKDPIIFIMGTSYYIYPAPTVANSIEMFYMKNPTTLAAAGDTVSVLVEYEIPLTLAAVEYLLRTDNQQARADQVKAELIQHVQGIQAAYGNTSVVEKVGGSK